MWEHIKLYLILIRAFIKSRMEYRASFLFHVVGLICAYLSSFLAIWVLLRQFHTINGWNFAEIAFLYSLALLSYGLGATFFWSFHDLQFLIIEGRFDRFLIRPLDPFFQLVSRFEITTLGHLTLGITIFVIASRLAGIEWNLLNLGFLLLVVLGAVLIQWALAMFSAAASFWILKSSSLYALAIYSPREFIWYPLSIYGKTIQILLTFLLPFAFVNFFPAQYFLQKSDFGIFPPLFQYLTPLVGIGMFILAYKFWKVGVNHYQSTGS